MFAASMRNMEIAKLLVQNGARINQVGTHFLALLDSTKSNIVHFVYADICTCTNRPT